MLLSDIAERNKQCAEIKARYPLFTKGSVVGWALFPQALPFLYARVTRLCDLGFFLDRYPIGQPPFLIEYPLLFQTEHGFMVPGGFVPQTVILWQYRRSDRQTGKLVRERLYIWRKPPT